MTWQRNVMLAVRAASYPVSAGSAWLRYGHPTAADDGEADALPDRFMPAHDVVDRHQIEVAAPAPVTFQALMNMDLKASLVVRAIFKAREFLLGGRGADRPPARLVEMTKALGWVVLARPWESNVVFRGIPAEHFAAFDEPDYVKIVWTLRADAVDAERSIARTETRAVATDAQARRKFRWYWARFSPGIVLIREMAQRLVKKEAERRARIATAVASA